MTRACLFKIYNKTALGSPMHMMRSRDYTLPVLYRQNHPLSNYYVKLPEQTAS